MQSDAISRSGLQGQVIRKKSGIADKRYIEGFNDAILRMKSMIHAAPALDVAPVVHAYWKKTYDLIDGHDGYECSACGYTKYFDHYAEGIALCKPFCCNCGARMDGEADV